MKNPSLCALALAAVMGLFVAGAPAAIADEANPVADAAQSRQYGPEDGLRSEGGVVDLGAPSSEVTIQATTTFTRGTTFAMTTHDGSLSYDGGARAFGNVWSGARWISALFKYTRNGVNLISWQESNATASTSCVWSAGSLKTASVSDSLDPNAPVTKFAYDFRSINTGIC